MLRRAESTTTRAWASNAAAISKIAPSAAGGGRQSRGRGAVFGAALPRPLGIPAFDRRADQDGPTDELVVDEDGVEEALPLEQRDIDERLPVKPQEVDRDHRGRSVRWKVDFACGRQLALLAALVRAAPAEGHLAAHLPDGRGRFQ